MIILRVGDPHIKPTNLEEAEKLMEFIYQTALDRKVDRVELLGDLAHTHSILRLEVLAFWDKWLDKLSAVVELVVLIGNHDMATNQEDAPNALLAFRHLKRQSLIIVNRPLVSGVFGYMPYYHDNDKFIEVAALLGNTGAKVIVCHGTFDGSKFESGAYAPNGVDPSKIYCDLIISGHIHSRQVLKNGSQTIIYPGTPKWDTASDANEDKGIWLYEHDNKTGAIISEELIRTGHVVTKLVSLDWTEGKDLPAIPGGCKVSINLTGSSAWVSQQKKALKGTVSISTKITDRANVTARIAGKDLSDFVKNFYVSTMDREHLLAYMRELKIV